MAGEGAQVIPAPRNAGWPVVAEDGGGLFMLFAQRPYPAGGVFITRWKDGGFDAELKRAVGLEARWPYVSVEPHSILWEDDHWLLYLCTYDGADMVWTLSRAESAVPEGPWLMEEVLRVPILSRRHPDLWYGVADPVVRKVEGGRYLLYSAVRDSHKPLRIDVWESRDGMAWGSRQTALVPGTTWWTRRRVAPTGTVGDRLLLNCLGDRWRIGVASGRERLVPEAEPIPLPSMFYEAYHADWHDGYIYLEGLSHKREHIFGRIRWPGEDTTGSPFAPSAESQ